MQNYKQLIELKTFFESIYWTKVCVLFRKDGIMFNFLSPQFLGLLFTFYYRCAWESFSAKKIDHPLVIPRYKHLVLRKVLKMNMGFLKYCGILPFQYRNSYNSPLKPGWCEGGCRLPRFLLKLTFYQLKMIVKRKKVAKNISHFSKTTTGNSTIVHFM